jgi:ribonucleoside-diphosphate reductase beta chain
MSIIETSSTYYPKYPELVELVEKHEKAHWGTWEVSLKDDLVQWQSGVIDDENKAFIKTILRVFTEGDKEVAKDYYEHLIPVFKNNEARNLFGSYANREGVHQRAYAMLNDTLGFGKDFYEEFRQHKAAREKLEYMGNLSHASHQDTALSLGKQVFIEGVGLFALFAMLLNYSRFGLLSGMCDVNLWSIRDESMHVEGNSTVFRIFLNENPSVVTDNFKKELYETRRKCIEIEDAFIEGAFKHLSLESQTKLKITCDETKQYIRAVADYRGEQLGLKKEYNVSNPFDWLDWVTSSDGMENFFEVNTVNYSKGAMVGSYEGGY